MAIKAHWQLEKQFLHLINGHAPRRRPLGKHFYQWLRFRHKNHFGENTKPGSWKPHRTNVRIKANWAQMSEVKLNKDTWISSPSFRWNKIKFWLERPDLAVVKTPKSKMKWKGWEFNLTKTHEPKMWCECLKKTNMSLHEYSKKCDLHSMVS